MISTISGELLLHNDCPVHMSAYEAFTMTEKEKRRKLEIEK